MLFILCSHLMICTLQDLSVEGLKKFLEEKSVPLVTEMNKDPASHSFLLKFFNTVATKVLCRTLINVQTTM